MSAPMEGFDPMGELVRHRRRLGAGALAGLALSLAYVLLAPSWYESTLTLLTTAPAKGAAGLMNAVGLGDLPFDLNVGNSDTDRIVAVLHSRSVTDAILTQLDLPQRYGDRTLDRARETLWQHCTTKLDKKASAVVLTCEDRDPALAQRMVERFGQVGNATFRRVSASTAGEERRFLDARVQQTHTDLDSASRKLRSFQEQHKIIDLGEQSKAVVSALASLKGELLSKQLQLSYLHSFSSDSDTSAQQLRQQLTVMESKLRALEEPAAHAAGKGGDKPDKAAGDLFPAAMAVPELRYELEQLMREQKIQETLFLLLTQRLELAKVNEARDTSAFQVLDAPVVALDHARPKRKLIVLTGTLAALLLTLVSIWLKPWWRARREEDRRGAWRDREERLV